MRSPRLRRRAPTLRRVVAVGLVVVGGACTGSGDAATTNWNRLDDVAYVLPARVPKGWTLAHATERTGRPRDKWTFRSDIYADTKRTRFVVLTVGPTKGIAPSTAPRATGGLSMQGRPATLIDGDAENLGYLFIYTTKAAPPKGSRQLGFAWVNDTTSFSAVEVSTAPDRRFITDIAEQLRGTAKLDIRAPARLKRAGLTYLASGTELENIADYGLSWIAPSGTTGELSINGGGFFYAQGALPTGAARTAKVTTADGRLQMSFGVGGLLVTLSSVGLDEARLRAIAVNLKPHSRAAWRKTLGRRLVLDEPEDR